MDCPRDIRLETLVISVYRRLFVQLLLEPLVPQGHITLRQIREPMEITRLPQIVNRPYVGIARDLRDIRPVKNLLLHPVAEILPAHLHIRQRIDTHIRTHTLHSLLIEPAQTDVQVRCIDMVRHHAILPLVQIHPDPRRLPFPSAPLGDLYLHSALDRLIRYTSRRILPPVENQSYPYIRISHRKN